MTGQRIAARPTRRQFVLQSGRAAVILPLLSVPGCRRSEPTPSARTDSPLDDGLKVCATDFDAYMKANLFVPFGMTSSGYLYREGMARPHDEQGRMMGGRKATAIHAARYGSAGELHTTPTDYAKFLIEFIDPKPSDAFRLSAASLREMVRPHAKVTDSLSWGLGWAIEHKKTGGDVLNHSGDNPGFKALTAAALEQKSALIVMTNGDRGFGQILAKVVMSEPMQQFLPVTVAI
jgi:CubicO group peptidase (beta-lactamase class C family)